MTAAHEVGGPRRMAGGGAQPLRAGTASEPREAGRERSRAPRSRGGALTPFDMLRAAGRGGTPRSQPGAMS